MLTTGIVVLDMNSSDGGAFRLVAAYASRGTERPAYFKRLNTFRGTPRTLVLVGNRNAALDGRFNCLGFSDR